MQFYVCSYIHSCKSFATILTFTLHKANKKQSKHNCGSKHVKLVMKHFIPYFHANEGEHCVTLFILWNCGEKVDILTKNKLEEDVVQLFKYLGEKI